MSKRLADENGVPTVEGATAMFDAVDSSREQKEFRIATVEGARRQREAAKIQRRVARLNELEVATQTKELSHSDWQEFDEELRTLRYRAGDGPLVGMPVTFHCGSDRYSGEVVAVTRKGATVTAKLKGLGLREFTFRKAGGTNRYREKGQHYGYLTFLKSEDYSDPSF